MRLGRGRLPVRGALAPLVLASALLLTSCSDSGFSGLYGTPLPGGADVGDHPFRITAQFTDVLDLVPQASVKVSDVAVGRVERIELAPDTKSATVSMLINGDVNLPANANADLRQSSLLGEKFVELRSPEEEEARGSLGDGAVIPLARTSRHAELEEVLGALSLLLSGGGVEQLRTIAAELNDAFSGNEAEIRSLLSRVDQLVAELDGQKGEIVKAIDGMNRLAGTLVREKRNLADALDNLSPGLRVVAEQTDQIVDMLESLHTLSDVTVDTIDKSRNQMVDNLRALEPTLRKLAEAGSHLPEALKIIPMYPLPWNAGNVVKGDFANVDVRFKLNLDELIENMNNAGRPAFGLGGEQDSGPPSSEQDLPLPGVLPPLTDSLLPEPDSSRDGGGPSGLVGSLLGAGQ
ncbi:MAG: MCE family protein [Haloechinothrix sp.]